MNSLVRRLMELRRIASSLAAHPASRREELRRKRLRALLNYDLLETRQMPANLSAIISTVFAVESVNQFIISIALDTIIASTVTLDYATSDITATAGSDYKAISGTAVIAPSDTKWVMGISVTDDGVAQGDETFRITFSNPVNATYVTSLTYDFTIQDNDSAPTVSFSPTTASVAESAGKVSLTATLSASSSQTITVDYATSNLRFARVAGRFREWVLCII